VRGAYVYVCDECAWLSLTSSCHSLTFIEVLELVWEISHWAGTAGLPPHVIPTSLSCLHVRETLARASALTTLGRVDLNTPMPQAGRPAAGGVAQDAVNRGARTLRRAMGLLEEAEWGDGFAAFPTLLGLAEAARAQAELAMASTRCVWCIPRLSDCDM
jgi:hypothetical protein